MGICRGCILTVTEFPTVDARSCRGAPAFQQRLMNSVAHANSLTKLPLSALVSRRPPCCRAHLPGDTARPRSEHHHELPCPEGISHPGPHLRVASGQQAAAHRPVRRPGFHGIHRRQPLPRQLRHLQLQHHQRSGRWPVQLPRDR